MVSPSLEQSDQVRPTWLSLLCAIQRFFAGASAAEDRAARQDNFCVAAYHHRASVRFHCDDETQCAQIPNLGSRLREWGAQIRDFSIGEVQHAHHPLRDRRNRSWRRDHGNGGTELTAEAEVAAD